MFRPAYTPAVDLWTLGMQQPRPKSGCCQHRSVQTHGDLPSPSAEGIVTSRHTLVTSARDSSCHRSITAVVPGIKAQGSSHRVSAFKHCKHSFSRVSRVAVSVAPHLGDGMPREEPAAARLFDA